MISQSKITVKRLLEAFPELTQEQAKDLFIWIQKPISISEDDFVAEFRKYDLEFSIWSKAQCVDKIMEKVREWLNVYSVEAIRDKRYWDNYYYHDIRALYLNMGDTYDVTLIYDTKEEIFYIGSWGDFYEQKRIKDPTCPD